MNWFSAFLISAQISTAPLPPAPHDCFKNCQVDQSGEQLIREFEGISLISYPDPAGKATIGVGHLILPGEDFPRPLTPSEADELLARDLARIAKAVNQLVIVRLHQHQFNSLTSFTFNLGQGNLKASTLLKRVNAGQHDQVPPQFMRWINAGGKPSDGLIRRRKAESVMYVG